MGYGFTGPRHLPALPDLLRDLGLSARLPEVAAHLGVSLRTVHHWLKTGNAPRSALLALWWETHEARGILLDKQTWETTLYYGRMRSAERAADALRERVARLEATGEFGAANAPTMRAL